MIRKGIARLISVVLAGAVITSAIAFPKSVKASSYEDFFRYCNWGAYDDDDDDDDYMNYYYLSKMDKDDYETLVFLKALAEAEEAHENRNVSVTGVCVSSTAVQLPAGGCYQITGYVKPDNANNKGVCYYSSNPSVATVDGNGVIRAITPGTCYIVTKTSEGGYEAYTSMTVYPNLPQ